MDTLVRVAVAQINAVVGDLDGNVARIDARLDEARAAGAQLVVFPELAVTGYPPEDLLLQPAFVAAAAAALDALAPRTRGLAALVGAVTVVDGDLRNAAVLFVDGARVAEYHKCYLPTYGVFDEDRYFRAGTAAPIWALGDVPVGVAICEDLWYPAGPAALAAAAGAALLLVPNASPYHRGKPAAREAMLATRARDTGAFVVYANLVGGQDELVFDGGSVIVDPSGRVVARAGLFAEELLVADLALGEAFRTRLHDPLRRKERLLAAAPPESVPRRALPPLPARADGAPVVSALAAPLEECAEVYGALVLGTRDYLRKTGFRAALIGLSGGIDSALVAAIAVDALGADAVTGVALPSRYSSPGSVADAADLAARLGVRLLRLPIEAPFAALLAAVDDALAPAGRALAEENLQARARGTMLMALSNAGGALVLTTGNKSELAVGYATLYGDMAGGFAVLKDVPKTLVYALARWRNAQPGGAVIPASTLTKPPSAELRPDQRDDDALPAYDVLDPILQAYVEEDRAPAEIVARGADPAVVARVVALVDHAEYKRRQAPPGVRVSPRAFGRDRRLPIARGRWA